METTDEQWERKEIGDLFDFGIPSEEDSAGGLRDLSPELPIGRFTVRAFGEVFEDVGHARLTQICRAGAIGTLEVRTQEDEWVDLVTHPDFTALHAALKHRAHLALDPSDHAVSGETTTIVEADPIDTMELGAGELEGLLENSQPATAVLPPPDEDFESETTRVVKLDVDEELLKEGAESDDELGRGDADELPDLEFRELPDSEPTEGDDRAPLPVRAEPEARTKEARTDEARTEWPTPGVPDPEIADLSEGRNETGESGPREVRACGQKGRPAAPLRGTLSGMQMVHVQNDATSFDGTRVHREVPEEAVPTREERRDWTLPAMLVLSVVIVSVVAAITYVMASGVV